MKHQPFLFYNNQNKINLLFCNSIEKINLFFGNSFEIDPWKIYLKNENNIEFPIETLKEDLKYGKVFIECNPHLFHKNNLLYFGYNAGFSKGKNTPIIYRYVYFETDLNLNVLSDYNIKDQVCFNSMLLNDDFFYIKKYIHRDYIIKNSEKLEIPLNIKRIYKISPIFNNFENFIITFEDSVNLKQSWLLNIDGSIVKEIKNKNNESIYKCSILDNFLAYSIKTENDTYIVEEKF
jgi:hypothetical protein